MFEESGDSRASPGKRPRPDDEVDFSAAKRSALAFGWEAAILAAVEAAARVQISAGASPPESGVSIKLLRKAVCSAAKASGLAALKTEGAPKASLRACKSAKGPRQEAFASALDALKGSSSLAAEAKVIGLTDSTLSTLLAALKEEGVVAEDGASPAAASTKPVKRKEAKAKKDKKDKKDKSAKKDKKPKKDKKE